MCYVESAVLVLMNNLSSYAYLEFLNMVPNIKETPDGHWLYIGWRDKYRKVPDSIGRRVKEVSLGQYISPYSLVKRICNYRDSFGHNSCLNPEHLEVTHQVPTYLA